MISGLTRVTTISGGDSIPLGVSSQGDDRATSVTDLLAYMQANIVVPSGFPEYTTQYASPPLTGFNIAVSNVAPGANIFLIIRPGAPGFNGIITYPPILSLVDKQEIMVYCQSQIVVLTTAPNGAFESTPPTAIPVGGGFFRVRYDLVSTTWYRVG